MTEKKSNVKRIFDSIAYRYDLLNHLLSFGLDFYWRKKALKLTGMNPDSMLLDVACGTGDFAIAAKKMGVENIFGADFSKKSGWITGRTVQMVAETMPIKSDSVTNITVAFGVRNFYDIIKGFKSFHEILTPGGKATILEFRLPSNKFLKTLYKFYFTKILPIVGGIISGDKEAYEYLPSSVEEFDEKVNLPELLKTVGFESVEQHNLTFGTVQIIIATKLIT
jgi:demethylmenaquinone methyltransferase/2-methoxy-6-polyprenyl-1,4-benzoquinol methylase